MIMGGNGFGWEYLNVTISVVQLGNACLAPMVWSPPFLYEGCLKQGSTGYMEFTMIHIVIFYYSGVEGGGRQVTGTSMVDWVLGGFWRGGVGYVKCWIH